jgi:SAM-dependent methyltransferase
MLNNNQTQCPVCSSILQKKDQSYSIEELFKMWSPVQFSQATIEEHRQQGEYTQMYACPECKLDIFLPQIIGTSGFFADLLKYESCYFYSKEKWDFDEAFQDAKGCASIIELGCGPGNFLEKMRPYVGEVYGTEYNERALETARGKGLNVFGVDDKGALKMKGTFDAAFSFHVLEHVPDPVFFIQEMLSWINPNGKMGISVPNMEGPIKYINPCISNMPPHHATRWQLVTFRKLADRLGLKIERVAFEPLSADSHSYYSVHWAQKIFPGNSFMIKLLRHAIWKSFSFLFAVLSFFNKKEFPFLRGQSIYILLSRKIN